MTNKLDKHSVIEFLQVMSSMVENYVEDPRHYPRTTKQSSELNRIESQLWTIADYIDDLSYTIKTKDPNAFVKFVDKFNAENRKKDLTVPEITFMYDDLEREFIVNFHVGYLKRWFDEKIKSSKDIKLTEFKETYPRINDVKATSLSGFYNYLKEKIRSKDLGPVVSAEMEKYLWGIEQLFEGKKYKDFRDELFEKELRRPQATKNRK